MQCGKAFAQSGHLKGHKLVHTGEKKFLCTKCDKAFPRSNYLKEHMRVHTGEKPFACTQCDKAFSYSSNMKRHKLFHTGENLLVQLSCNLCDKYFSRPENLNRHMLNHPGQKAFICTQCNRAFSELTTLKKHKLKHTYIKEDGVKIQLPVAVGVEDGAINNLIIQETEEYEIDNQYTRHKNKTI